MKPSDNVKAILKELDAQRIEFAHLARLTDEQIKEKFHDTVTNQLKSIAARAYNMEAQHQGLM